MLTPGSNWRNRHLKFLLKLLASARTRPFLFSRTELNNLLNKIQFTFEVVSCLILGLSNDFLKVWINFSPALQGGGWVGGQEMGIGIS